MSSAFLRNFICAFFLFFGLCLPKMSLAATSTSTSSAVKTSKIFLGVDVLESTNFAILKGKRVGLLTNPAGVNNKGISTVSIFNKSRYVNLVALFGPEHGIYGNEKAEVPVLDKIDAKTGLPVFSLYGKYRKPSPEMLRKIDVLVVDLQDVGCRSYTYVSCMLLCMEACFEHGKEIVILDRPNPLGGLKVGGAMLDMEFKSYVGMFPAPYVHGLTIGEIARMAKAEKGWLNIPDKVRNSGKLSIVQMAGWKRSMMWTDTGLKWVPTSPAIQDFSACLGYSMVGLGCQIGGFKHGCEGKYHFRILTYKGKDPSLICSMLRARRIKGLQFDAVKLKSGASGVYVSITDWQSLRPVDLSYHLMVLACEISGGNPFASASKNDALLFNKHVGSKRWWNELVSKGKNADLAFYTAQFEVDAKKFQEKSKNFWLYK